MPERNMLPGEEPTPGQIGRVQELFLNHVEAHFTRQAMRVAAAAEVQAGGLSRTECQMLIALSDYLMSADPKRLFSEAVEELRRLARDIAGACAGTMQVAYTRVDGENDFIVFGDRDIFPASVVIRAAGIDLRLVRDILAFYETGRRQGVKNLRWERDQIVTDMLPFPAVVWSHHDEHRGKDGGFPERTLVRAERGAPANLALGIARGKLAASHHPGS